MKNKISICLFVLMGIVIVYAIASIVCICINFSVGRIFDIIITIMACMIFSIILFLSGKMKWGGFLEKHGHSEKAEMYNNALAKMQKEKEEQTLSDKIEQAKAPSSAPEKSRFNVKQFLVGLFVLLVFGGAGCGIVYFGSTQYARITGNNYIKTTATIERVVVETDKSGNEIMDLRYVFFDEEENKVFANYASGFVGIVPTEGNKVTIYYNRYHPQYIETLSTPIMMYLMGGFFIAVSFLAFLQSLGFNQNNNSKLAPILIGGIFSGFAVTLFTAMHLSIGGNVVLTLLAGGGLYAVGCFGMLGFYFMLFGIVGLFKSIFKSIFGGKI